jgi:hypothetical protein
MRWINLTKLSEEQLTPWYRELLRRGWVWLIVDEAGQAIEEHA